METCDMKHSATSVPYGGAIDFPVYRKLDTVDWMAGASVYVYILSSTQLFLASKNSHRTQRYGMSFALGVSGHYSTTMMC